MGSGSSIVSRFPNITLDRLGRMQVLETIDYEALVVSRMLKFKENWIASDPPLGAAYDVENLEFDPIKINQEANSYFETMLRDRVNQAARAVTLAYATGRDLDAIGSRYPYSVARATMLAYARSADYLPTQSITPGVPRLALIDTPRGMPWEVPEDWEDDERYRRRLWLAGSAFSTAGAEDAYIFWALTTVPTLRDASVTVTRPSRFETPTIFVTLLKNAADPRPTDQDIIDINTRLHKRDVKPATDVVSVRPPFVVPIDWKVDLTLYPGADKELRKTQVLTELLNLKEKKRYLGEDQTIASIEGASVSVGDVQNAKVTSLLADVKMSPRQFGLVNTIDVRVVGFDE